jgi:hypothetical protein
MMGDAKSIKKHQKAMVEKYHPQVPQPTSCTGQPNGRWGRMKHLGYRNLS